MRPRVLVAGVGNIFFGDDAFGVEVARRLRTSVLPENVKVEDYGIRGVHLAYELLDGYDVLVLVDALPMAEPAGTIAIIEPELVPITSDREAVPVVEAHSMSPAVVLAMVSSLGAKVDRVVIVACQPRTVDEGIGLSTAVAAAVDVGAATVIEVVEEISASFQEGRVAHVPPNRPLVTHRRLGVPCRQSPA